MEMLEGLLTRRSVRRFISDRPVEKNILAEIIKAAQYAPSAHNKQEWEFVVMEDKKFLEDLPNHQPWTAFAKDASAAVIICGNLSDSFQDETKAWNFADIDCSLAAENLMLAAHAKGLGSCMCAISPIPALVDGFSKLLALPGHIKPFAIVVLGHPEGGVKQPENRFKEDKIHWGKW